MATFELIEIVFGSLWLAVHLVATGIRLHSAKNRYSRLEALGGAVPGMAGILIILIFYTPLLLIKILLALLSLVIIVFGRALYELIVFKHQGPRT